MTTINVLGLLRKYWRELLILCLSSLTIWLATRKDRIKTVTTVEYVDRVVVKTEEKVVYRNRDIVKTRTIVKKGDETRVEERTETKQRDVATGIRTEKETVTERRESQSVVTNAETTRFLLGVSRNFSDGSYTGNVLYRVFPGIPGYVGPTLTINRGIFTLGIGVTVAL